ncbi:MAG: SurA N-terminal domain-containing protein, partial [Nitrospirota bacterium]
MKTTSIAGIVACIGALFFLLFIASASRHTTAKQQSSVSDMQTQVVATVGRRPITLAEVEQTVALSLYQLEEQRTKLLRESTQHLIEEELLAAEAARVGVTVSDL